MVKCWISGGLRSFVDILRVGVMLGDELGEGEEDLETTFSISFLVISCGLIENEIFFCKTRKGMEKDQQKRQGIQRQVTGSS